MGKLRWPPGHQVTLTTAFYVCVHEVTQAEWQVVMGWNESTFRGDLKPVEQVTWFDALIYCNRRSAGEDLDSVYVMTGRSYQGVHVTGADSISCDWEKNGYRLPTEAEWEHACRAGSTTSLCNGWILYVMCGLEPVDPNLDLVAWYNCNSSGTTHDVGGKAANAWGVKDTHGNVREWCWDRLSMYTPDPVTDPRGAIDNSCRVWKGGSWASNAQYCRSADRGSWWHVPDYYSNSVGLRVVRNAL